MHQVIAREWHCSTNSEFISSVCFLQCIVQFHTLIDFSYSIHPLLCLRAGQPYSSRANASLKHKWDLDCEPPIHFPVGNLWYRLSNSLHIIFLSLSVLWLVPKSMWKIRPWSSGCCAVRYEHARQRIPRLGQPMDHNVSQNWVITDLFSHYRDEAP